MVRSRYEEDVYPGNHTSVWGSYWHDGQWGYKCCHSYLKNSYCVGQAGKSAVDEPEVIKESVSKKQVEKIKKAKKVKDESSSSDSSSGSSSGDDNWMKNHTLKSVVRQISLFLWPYFSNCKNWVRHQLLFKKCIVTGFRMCNCCATNLFGEIKSSKWCEICKCSGNEIDHIIFKYRFVIDNIYTFIIQLECKHITPFQRSRFSVLKQNRKFHQSTFFGKRKFCLINKFVFLPWERLMNFPFPWICI